MEQSIRLKDLVEEKFSDYQFILVSNRAPYMHIYRGGEVEVIMPASGMAIALDSLMQTSSSTRVAAGSGEADQEAVVGAGCHHQCPPKTQNISWGGSD